MVWRCASGLDVILALIFVTFSTLRTLSFSDLRFYEDVVTGVPCERNSSYNFIPTFFKLCTCFPHGLEICMWFRYNPWIMFCHFCHFVNFVIFWPQILWMCIDNGYLVSATPNTFLYRSLRNFAHVFAMVSRCAYGLDIILELIFVTFPLCELCHFLTSDSMKVYRQWLPCKCNSLYNFMPIFLQLCPSFFSMVWRCACGLDLIMELIFVTFPLCDLCHFSQVRHQLHQSSIYIINCIKFTIYDELLHFKRLPVAQICTGYDLFSQ